MDERSGKARGEVSDADAALEPAPAFMPLDPAELAEPNPHLAGYGPEGARAGAPDDDSPREISPLRVAIAVIALLALGGCFGAAITYAVLHRSATSTPAPSQAVISSPVAAPPLPAVAPVPPPSAPPPAASDVVAKPEPAPRVLPRMIANPVWLRRPTEPEVSRLYPSPAQDEGLGGEATIDCAVTASGHLGGCAVVAERPLRRGFGPATLKLAPRFQMKAVTRSGEPVEGRRVRVPVRWRLN